MELEVMEGAIRDRASAVRRLRVAATSDPQRADELADALVALTAARLRACDPAEAALDAPESVVVAARRLAERGASGPYASVPDAVRYAAATVQLAAVQADLGQADAAGRTLDGLDAWLAQLRLPLVGSLADEVVLRALLARARSLLPADPAAANAYADAAEVRLHAADPPAYLAVAVHLATADCRWAAGRPEAALAHHQLALDAHRAVLAGLGGRPRPAVARIALAPSPSTLERYAARLTASGDTAGGLALRRSAVDLAEAVGDPEVAAVARSGLAGALVAAGRGAEADALGVPPAAAASGAPGSRVDWAALPPERTWGAGDPGAHERWRRAEQAAGFAVAAARAEAERDEAARAEAAAREATRLAAARTQAERDAAARAAAAAAARERARRAQEERAAERARREEAAARAAAEERRRALAEEHRRVVDPEQVRSAAAELELARRAVAAAGDEPAALAAATERLASLLRPLATADQAHVPEFLGVLDELVGLRWRRGDAEGSRAAAREARAVRGEGRGERA